MNERVIRCIPHFKSGPQDTETLTTLSTFFFLHDVSSFQCHRVVLARSLITKWAGHMPSVGTGSIRGKMRQSHVVSRLMERYRAAFPMIENTKSNHNNRSSTTEIATWSSYFWNVWDTISCVFLLVRIADTPSCHYGHSVDFSLQPQSQLFAKWGYSWFVETGQGLDLNKCFINTCTVNAVYGKLGLPSRLTYE